MSARLQTARRGEEEVWGSTVFVGDETRMLRPADLQERACGRRDFSCPVNSEMKASPSPDVGIIDALACCSPQCSTTPQQQASLAWHWDVMTAMYRETQRFTSPSTSPRITITARRSVCHARR